MSFTELGQAAWDGNTKLLIELLEDGANVGQLDEYGNTALDLAVLQGRYEAMEELVNRGAELDATAQLGSAAFGGHVHICHFMLERGADATFTDPASGQTFLHSAICKANRPKFNAVVEALLAAGADPNAKTIPGVPTGAFMRDVRTRGETPLHRAAAFGDEVMIQLLLSAGADKTIKDANGDSPLSWASWHLRPGKILSLLCYGEFEIGEWIIENVTADHGRGYGDGMEGR